MLHQHHPLIRKYSSYFPQGANRLFATPLLPASIISLPCEEVNPFRVVFCSFFCALSGKRRRREIPAFGDFSRRGQSHRRSVRPRFRGFSPGEPARCKIPALVTLRKEFPTIEAQIRLLITPEIRSFKYAGKKRNNAHPEVLKKGSLLLPLRFCFLNICPFHSCFLLPI